MNRRQFTKLLAGAGLLLAGCRAGAAPSSSTPERKDSMQTTTQTYTRTTPIETVRNDPVFGDYGRLIFPVERSYYSGDTLEQLHLTYYNNIDPDETVDIRVLLKPCCSLCRSIYDFGFHLPRTPILSFPKKTNNPNPSPIGNKFGLFLFGPSGENRTHGLLSPIVLHSRTHWSKRHTLYAISLIFESVFSFYFV